MVILRGLSTCLKRMSNWLKGDNMRNFWKRTCIAGLLCTCMTATVGHAAEYTIKTDIQTRRVTISGMGESKENINILCRARQDANTPITPENATEQIYVAHSIKTDETGVFDKTFELPERENDGWYILTLRATQDTEPQTFTFFCPSTEIFGTMLTEFNQANIEDIDALMVKYSEEYPILQFDQGDYALYKAEICQAILQERTQLGGQFLNETQINECINENLAFYSIKNSTTETLAACLEKYETHVGLVPDPAYETWKDDFINMFLNKLDLLTDITALQKIYRQTMALTALNHAGREEITAVLTRYNDDVFQLDLSGDYQTYNPIEVNKGLYNKNYVDVESVHKDYEKRIQELKNQNLGSSFPPSSGGGGGGGGGFVIDTSANVNDVEEVLNGETTSDKEFQDLDSVPWAEKAIQELLKKGYISGISETEFAPNRSITRAEACRMIQNVCGFQTETIRCDFEDVLPQAWYFDAVCTMANMQIVFGMDGTHFCPEDEITRQDMAVILARAVKSAGKELTQTELEFADTEEIAPYAREAVAGLAKEGIIHGMDENYFRPTESITRAQAAVMLYEFSVRL